MANQKLCINMHRCLNMEIMFMLTKKKAIELYRMSANEGNINAIKYYTNIVNK